MNEYESLPISPDKPKTSKAYIQRAPKDRTEVRLRLDYGTTYKLSVVQHLPELKTSSGRVLSRSLLARRALQLYLDMLLAESHSEHPVFMAGEKMKLEEMASLSNKKYAKPRE